jgi:hypothetical protein
MFSACKRDTNVIHTDEKHLYDEPVREQIFINLAAVGITDRSNISVYNIDFEDYFDLQSRCTCPVVDEFLLQLN